MEVPAEAVKDDGSPCWVLTPGVAVETVPYEETSALLRTVSLDW